MFSYKRTGMDLSNQKDDFSSNNVTMNKASIRKHCQHGADQRCNRSCLRSAAGEQSRRLKSQSLLAVTRVQHTPSSNETIVQAQLAHYLESISFQEPWVFFATSKVGNNESVNAAALAVLYTKQYQAGNSRKASALKAALWNYGRAITLVNLSLASATDVCPEETLLSMGLLTLYELLAAPRGIPTCAVHWVAIGTILLAHPSAIGDSELRRALLYSIWERTFNLPCQLGVVSPFESIGEELQNAVPSVGKLSPILRLQRYGSVLHIRLPRLIAEVRIIRANDGMMPDMSTINLAEQLLEASEESAENAILHRLKVTKSKTDLLRGAALTDWSFEFQSVSEMTALAVYWTTNVMLIRLCLILAPLSPSSKVADSREKLEADQERMAINILMSWQYAYAHGYYAMINFSEALLAVWAALTDRRTLRGIPATDVKAWLLSTFNGSLAEYDSLQRTCDDIDAASDIFAGGPLNPVVVLPVTPSLEAVFEGRVRPRRLITGPRRT